MSSERTKKRGFLERLMLLVNVFVLISLLLSYLAGSISPVKFWPLAFIGMAYPALLAATAFFTLYWLLKRRWFLFVNIALVLVKWDHVQETVQFRKTSQETVENGIKVMSFNVRLFDYFNWTNDRNTRGNSYKFISQERPDILCIQEFYKDGKDYFPTMDTLLASNKIKHVHIENYRDKRTDDKIWGMATFSAFPIVGRGEINFTSTFGNRGIYSDLLMGTDTVRIYNVHLQSVRIGEDQYLMLDQIMMNKSLKGVGFNALIGDLKLLIYRMVHGFIERGKQADQVAEHIENCPYPVILCGDFNDTPSSYAYQRLSKSLQDTFVERGFGIGSTFVRLPFFRIDNIFHDGHFRAMDHTVYKPVLSDHFAISSTLVREN